MSQASEHPSSRQEKRALLARLLREKAEKDKSAHPLSHGQRAFWFIHRSAPESAAYNMVFSARIHSRVDVPALRRAFQALIMRHPALRTTFAVQDGKPVQEVHGYREVCFEETDVRSEDTLREQVLKASRRPFDLENGPVLRINLFTRSAADHVLLLTIHHIVSDGWSLYVLLDELRTIYQAESNGVPYSLPPLKRTCADYVQWQERLLSGSEGDRLWDYWRRQLADMPLAFDLPADHPRPPIQTYRGASHAFELSAGLVRQLHERSRIEGVTLFVTLAAAFQVLLYRYTGREDIPLGSGMAGENRSEFAEVAGYFANPVVLRADLSKNPAFKDFLVQVRRTVLEALAHQEYPFTLLAERLLTQRDPARPPLVQVAFVFQKPHRAAELMELLAARDDDGRRINWGGLTLGPFAMPQQEGQFDLVLEMAEKGGGLSGALKYNTDLFEADTMARMAGHFRVLLEAAAADSRTRVSELPLLTEAEQRRLHAARNDNADTEYQESKSIHQLFEELTEQAPNAIAAVFEDKQLSRGELNARANRLAHHLQTLGAGSEVCVGICVPPSLEMLTGLLGILKAGAGWLPLDTEAPEVWSAPMLKDVPIVLTQSGLLSAGKCPLSSEKHIVCLDSDEWENGQSEVNPHSEAGPENLAYVLYAS
ncbi:MAG: AMP-binding protein, partial [Gammaproteobacteria bacterium]|nr:AMP-binding protein [Gammaproteobacteria bacterium]